MSQKSYKLHEVFVELICGAIWIVASVAVIAGFVMVSTV